MAVAIKSLGGYLKLLTFSTGSRLQKENKNAIMALKKLKNKWKNI